MRVADLFAGAGGFSEGARQAGAEVVFAANHWPLAVDLHSKRHPKTRHACQDLRQFDFSTLPDIDLLLAAPACQGHSNAGRGARGKWGLNYEHHDTARTTALAVIDALEAKTPQTVIVENVPTFLDWKLFDWWLQGIQTLGYQTEIHTIDSSTWGVAQERTRVFIVGELGARPKPIIDPGLAKVPVSAILGTAGRWSRVDSKSANVKARVERGRANWGSTFITQHVTNHPGRPLWRPLPTVTTADQLCLVDGDFIRPLTIDEQGAAQGFKPGYFDGVRRRKDACRMIGNAVAIPVAKALVEQVAA